MAYKSLAELDRVAEFHFGKEGWGLMKEKYFATLRQHKMTSKVYQELPFLEALFEVSYSVMAKTRELYRNAK